MVSGQSWVEGTARREPGDSCRLTATPSWGRLRHQQPTHPQQVVSRRGEPGRQLHARHTAEAGLPQPTVALQPTKDGLDPSPNDLAGAVALLPCGSAIEGRAPSGMAVLG